MVNEKFRERVFAWDCFKKENSNEFPSFFDKVLKLSLSKFNSKTINLSYQEQSILIKFLDNCVNSLEIDIVRLQVQKICGLPMWVSLNENRREHEFKKFTKLRKFWRALEKNDSKLSNLDKERIFFERTFLKMLIKKFIDILNSFNSVQMESGELIDESIERKYKLHYMERFLEFLIDLEALLPTRRFFNTLLDDTNLLIHCYLSDLIKSDDKYDEYKLFRELFQVLKFYSTFEIDDQSGEAKTENEIEELHYEKLKSLQKGIFKYYRDELQSFSLTNIGTIDKRETLIKHLDSLSFDLIYSVAVYLNLVPDNSKENYSKDLIIEIIIWHMERPISQLEEINSLPLYPTEDVIWNENLIPSDNKRNLSSLDQCLALPKLNLQFLTLHDYLLRNFNLFRLESAYELKQDIEDACIRLKPYYSYEEQAVAFKSWSRMAQPIQNFTIIEVAKPFVGEQAPSRVRVDVTLDLECLREDIRNEWNNLRKHDIAFLVTLKPNNTPEQHYNPNESFIQQVGLQYVRGCEIEGILNDEGKVIGEDIPISKNDNDSRVKFSSHMRTYRLILDSNQYKIDNDKLSNQVIKEDLYNTFNVFVRRRPKENNFKAILESIRDLINTNFVVPEWLRDLILGYGDPNSANYKYIKNPSPLLTLNFNDTFLSFDHLKESFPEYEIELVKTSDNDNLKPPFKLTFNDLIKSETETNKKVIKVQPYNLLSRGPYPFEQPKVNQVKFTPTQIEAIKSGMQPGLTIVVGPPGTGKTDVAVQIISNIYHNFPDQKTLIVTHSNQALNQLFEKIMGLDIDERHLLRLGHGEEGLETEKDFSRYGRVNYVLTKRLEILDEVDRLQKSHIDFAICGDSVAYSCETAIHFYLNFVLPKWQIYTEKIKNVMDRNLENSINLIHEFFPFTNFFSNAPQPIFKKRSFTEDYEIANGMI
jgi:intron-binding protein aquarius